MYLFESPPTVFHSGYMPYPSHSSRFNHPDCIKWTVQTVKFLVVLPSPLPILLLLGQIFASESCFQLPLTCVPLSTVYKIITILLFIYFLFFFYSQREVKNTKVFGLNNNTTFPALNLHFVPSWVEFSSVNREPKFLKVFTFSYELIYHFIKCNNLLLTVG